MGHESEVGTYRQKKKGSMGGKKISFEMKGEEVIRVFEGRICVAEYRKSGNMGKVHLNGSESTKWLPNAGKCWTLLEIGQNNCLLQALNFVVTKQL